uniref:AAA+ ATPase domain-containing protein n=1 Tax=viral metagenome TaxID=1070528 RepID=A0A6C0LYK9_9ZZZZ
MPLRKRSKTVIARRGKKRIIEDESSSDDETYVDTSDGISMEAFATELLHNINESDAYWTPDRKMLRTILVSSLTESFPDLRTKNVEDAVKKALLEAGDKIVDEYVSATPCDERWKIGLQPAIIKKYEPRLQRIRSAIESDRITMLRILEADMSEDDRRKCIELYDIMNNIQPYTLEFMNIQSRIKRMLRQSTTKDADVPTVENIMKSNLSKEERDKCLELLDIMLYSASPNNVEGLSIVAEIKDILRRAPKDLSPSEIKIMRTRESDMKKEKNEHSIRKQIFDLKVDEKRRAIIYEKFIQLQELSRDDQNYANIKDWLLWVLQLPFDKIKALDVNEDSTNEEIREFVMMVGDRLNSRLAFMDDVKVELQQIINNRIRNRDTKGSRLGLCGVPGTGKSTIAEVLAWALGMPFERISLGGVIDAAMLSGMHGVWMKSTPSIIVQILSRMKHSNGIILFDEIDKLGETAHGKEVQYALLHITDYANNSEFRDQYLSDITIDLSRMWFMYAMNTADSLDVALRDRLNIVNVREYKSSEKCVIAQKYLLPEALENAGMSRNEIVLNDDGARYLLSLIGEDRSGMRPFKDEIESIVSRINMLKTAVDKKGVCHINLPYKFPAFNEWNGVLDRDVVAALWSKRRSNTDAIPMMYM